MFSTSGNMPRCSTVKNIQLAYILLEITIKICINMYAQGWKLDFLKI